MSTLIIKFFPVIVPMFILHHYAFHLDRFNPQLSSILAMLGALWFAGALVLINNLNDVGLHFFLLIVLWVAGIALLVPVMRHRLFGQPKLPHRRLFYVMVLMFQVLILITLAWSG